MTRELLYFNGINGATGEYLLPPLAPQQIAKVAQGQIFDPLELIELRQRWEMSGRQSMGVAAGIDPQNLAETGWGVIFAAEYKNSRYTATELKDALNELLDYRKQEATRKKEHYYREFIGSTAYYPGESKQDFLDRHRTGPGPANPEKMPYYLLIVGDPESIPYQFQYQLDVQYAVGRIHFNTLEEYTRYAHSVVETEKNQVMTSRKISLFGVHNNDDPATQLSANHLIQPLAQEVQTDKPDWSLQTLVGATATKSQLSQLLGGDETPAILFTASHGISFPQGHTRQLPHQGALICQDWPGPAQWQGQLDADDHYFSADDLGADAQLQGLIAFHFACYGAGTPQTDEFLYRSGRLQETIAPQAFVAKLPQRLLSHPQGGALAVIGHVERAWGCSFTWNDAGPQLQTFQDALKLLMEGKRIGFAMEAFNERYAELSSDLSTELEQIRPEAPVNHWKLAQMWTANNDARNYAIVGDPAVRLILNPVQQEQSVPKETIVLNRDQQIEDLLQRVEQLERKVDLLQTQNQLVQQQIDKL